MRHLSTPIAAALVVALAAPCEAFDPVTHVWVAEQVLADVAPDGRVTILGDEYPVPARVAQALRAHRAEYRMGAIGPDAVPDVLTGQEALHSGRRGWTSDRWLGHIEREADAPAALAFALGCWCHAAGDVFAHDYVNRYAGGTFDLTDGETVVETRHAILERFIARHTPLTDRSVRLPARFVVRALVADARADAQYAAAPGAQFVRAMAALERALARLAAAVPAALRPAVAEWRAGVAEATVAYVQANADCVRNLMDPGNTDPGRPLKDWGRRHGPTLAGVPSAGRAMAAAALDALARLPGPAQPELRRMRDATARLARELGERWLSTPALRQVELMRMPNTEDALARAFASDGTGRRLPVYKDMPRRVRADIGAAFGADFAPAANAVVLAKLALLDRAQLDALARKHGGTLGRAGSTGVMDGAVRSMDASEQWRGLGTGPVVAKLFRFPQAKGER